MTRDLVDTAAAYDHIEAENNKGVVFLDCTV